jgi:hypothetical protein
MRLAKCEYEMSDLSQEVSMECFERKTFFTARSSWFVQRMYKNQLILELNKESESPEVRTDSS